MDDLRVGIVGAGGMGSFHARTLADIAGVTVAAVADVHAPSAHAVHEAFGAEVVTDSFELVARPDIDALVIASPDATHAALAMAAVERELPTLCEKPLATSVDDARRVVDAEVAAGRRLVQLGFMREYDPAHVQLAAELPAIGRVVALRAVHRNAKSAPRPLEVIVGQSLVHDVHSVRFLTGAEIESIHGSAVVDCDEIRHVFVVCRLSNGGHAVLEFDDAGFAYEVAVEVVGRDGDVLTGAPLRAVRRRAGDTGVHLGADWFGWFADAYRAQDRAWVDSIRAGRPAGPSAWDGFVAQTVVDAILRSIASGDTMRVLPHDRPATYA